MDSVDRISELPDSVLCHILSLLPTKLSIATSVLARRWRFLWANVPTLDMNSKDHRNCSRKTNISGVYRFLLHQNVNALDTFRLCLAYGDFPVSNIDNRMETWIGTVIVRKVKTIELDLDSLVMLPRCLWTCNTLVDLRLRRCKLFATISRGGVCFPVLKKLYLDTIEYKYEELLGHLISGCPVLEELTIGEILVRDLFCYSISSPTIKRLIVKFQPNSWASHNHDYRLEINAPALEYLQVEDRLSEYISAQNLSFLTEADICIKNEKEKEDDDDYTGAVLGFVDELCNVNYLRLAIDHTEFYCSNLSGSKVKFDNLTKLELSADWRCISMFLEKADNLKVLILSRVDNEDLKCWMEPEQVPASLLLHLAAVRIDDFLYADDEFEMVSYLLRNAQVLNKMEIYFHTEVSFESEKFSAMERILQFERGSCELDFY